MGVEVYKVRVTDSLRKVLQKKKELEIAGVTPLRSYLQDDIPVNGDSFTITKIGADRFQAWLSEVQDMKQPIVPAKDLMTIQKSFEDAEKMEFSDEDLDTDSKRKLDSTVEKDFDVIRNRNGNKLQSDSRSMDGTFNRVKEINTNSIIDSFRKTIGK